MWQVRKPANNRAQGNDTFSRFNAFLSAGFPTLADSELDREVQLMLPNTISYSLAPDQARNLLSSPISYYISISLLVHFVTSFERKSGKDSYFRHLLESHKCVGSLRNHHQHFKFEQNLDLFNYSPDKRLWTRSKCSGFNTREMQSSTSIDPKSKNWFHNSSYLYGRKVPIFQYKSHTGVGRFPCGSPPWAKKDPSGLQVATGAWPWRSCPNLQGYVILCPTLHNRCLSFRSGSTLLVYLREERD